MDLSKKKILFADLDGTLIATARAAATQFTNARFIVKKDARM